MKIIFLSSSFYFFPLFYYTPIQRILRSDSKPVEMNGNLSSDLSGAWIRVFFIEILLWTLIILYKSNCSLSIVLLPFKSE